MQRANFQQANITQIQDELKLVLPGHGSGVDDEAINDEVYVKEDSPIKLVLSVFANVVGGALLLSGMFILPQLIGELLN